MQKKLTAPSVAITRKRGATPPTGPNPAPLAAIGRSIYIIRGQKVMLDADLAELYRVPTFRLNEAVKRNAKRFPEDFMFRLVKEEAACLTSQIAMSNERRGGRRTLPYAFTEHGVAMLSSVLNSERAVQMNILIIRAFVKLREMINTHKDLARRMERLENTQKDHSAVLTVVVKDIENLEKQVMREVKSLDATRRRKPPRFGFVTTQR